jgi:microcystin-dependent protein
MATPFLGEIRLVGFNFAPVGWAFCSGSLLAIAQNDALFSLIGTTYGGDGQNTFALPDLRSRVPIHTNGSFPIGGPGGSESVQINVLQLPSHDHSSTTCFDGDSSTGAPVNGATWSMSSLGPLYLGNAPTAVMANLAIALTGGNQAHENRQPSLAINYIIALEGIFPSQS